MLHAWTPVRNGREGAITGFLDAEAAQCDRLKRPAVTECMMDVARLLIVINTLSVVLIYIGVTRIWQD